MRRARWIRRTGKSLWMPSLRMSAGVMRFAFSCRCVRVRVYAYVHVCVRACVCARMSVFVSDIQLQAMARGVSTRAWFADKVAIMRQNKEMEKMEAAIQVCVCVCVCSSSSGGGARCMFLAMLFY